MSIEQHVEAAAWSLWTRQNDEMPSWGSLTRTERKAATRAIIARHMQAAIDEATATLKARVAALEGLGPLIEEYGDACEEFGRDRAGGIECTSEESEKIGRDVGDLRAKIDAILNGGAP